MSQPEISLDEVKEDLIELFDLAGGEFGCSLAALVAARDDLSMRRIGRLMAVTVKRPFASTFRYDPDMPWNWARSQRAWEILRPIPADLRRQYRSHYQVLAEVAEQWGRPEYKIAEWHIFHWLVDKLQPIVCGDSKVLANANEIAEKLRGSGTPVASLSAAQLISVVSVSTAVWMSDRLSLPTYLRPIVTGATLLVCCYGAARLCQLLTRFKKEHESDPDRLEGYPRCSSAETYNGEPCDKEVLKPGDRCHVHRPAGAEQ